MSLRTQIDENETKLNLSQSERDELVSLVSGGKLAVRRLKRMQILLAADEAIAASVQTSGSTIYRTKKRFVEVSLEAALSAEPLPGAARKLSGNEEVQLVRWMFSTDEPGRRWQRPVPHPRSKSPNHCDVTLAAGDQHRPERNDHNARQAKTADRVVRKAEKRKMVENDTEYDLRGDDHHECRTST